MRGLWAAVTRNRARTERASMDPALRGRTYAIAFDRVWDGALALAQGGLPGWTLVRADDASGVIEAQATTRFLGRVEDVRVRVSLDADGQTRVDAESASRSSMGDFGTNRRRIRRFMASLDARVGAAPSQILGAPPGTPPGGSSGTRAPEGGSLSGRA